MGWDEQETVLLQTSWTRWQSDGTRLCRTSVFQTRGDVPTAPMSSTTSSPFRTKPSDKTQAGQVEFIVEPVQSKIQQLLQQLACHNGLLSLPVANMSASVDIREVCHFPLMESSWWGFPWLRNEYSFLFGLVLRGNEDKVISRANPLQELLYFNQSPPKRFALLNFQNTSKHLRTEYSSFLV